MVYFFDLVGVAVFAVGGVLAACRRGLDLRGVIVIAAISGGSPAAQARFRHLMNFA